MKKFIYKFLPLALAFSILTPTLSVSAYKGQGDVKIASRFYEMLFGEKEEVARTLTVGGKVFGAKINREYVTVTEAKGVPKLRPGDIIISIGGKAVSSAAEVQKIVRESKGAPLTIVAKRGDTEIVTEATPTLSCSDYKIGLKLKDNATGIGTVTFIDKKTGVFGGLGHGICDADNGELIKTDGGAVTSVLLGGVHRGEVGKPGELVGVLTGKIVGKITANTDCGVFGILDTSLVSGGEEYEVAKSDAVHTGKAEIICTVKNGDSRKYSIEITEIENKGSPTKSFKIKVTDDTLIALTGGIVRGMSGSPIIQDGKLVGAVTHVLVANPTEGYGIFIENMLNAANNQSQQKAA